VEIDQEDQGEVGKDLAGESSESPRPALETCFHCDQDIVAHHYRNLKCPNAKTIYRRKLAMEANRPSIENSDSLETMTRDRDNFERELNRCAEIAQGLRAELKATQGLLNVKTAFLESAEKEIDQLKDALIWCSGSPDFSEDGQAHEGWLKLCAPLIAPERDAEIR